PQKVDEQSKLVLCAGRGADLSVLTAPVGTERAPDPIQDGILPRRMPAPENPEAKALFDDCRSAWPGHSSEEQQGRAKPEDVVPCALPRGTHFAGEPGAGDLPAPLLHPPQERTGASQRIQWSELDGLEGLGPAPERERIVECIHQHRSPLARLQIEQG